MSHCFELTVLGTGSATPTLKRNPSAQVLNVREKLFLIDCGEGTQLALRKNKIKFQRIEHIFISHLHGDHYLGLQGLLSTFGLLGRTQDLHIFSPPGLKDLVDLHFKISKSYLNYKLHFHELVENEKSLILETEQLRIYALPLKHRIKTYGYLFEEKEKLRQLDGKTAKELKIPHYAFQGLKEGKDFVDPNSAEVYRSENLTFPAPPSFSYAYCSDTDYDPDLAKLIMNVDLLYHETTFMKKDIKLARKTYHSTCYEAASIAKLAGAKKLLMGHYSSRYTEPALMLEECKSVFENTYMCQDDDIIKLS